MKLLVVFGLLVGLAPAAAQAQNSSLTVNVGNLLNTRGVCRYRLFRAAPGFPMDDSKAVKTVDLPITGTTSRYVFTDLPPGTYAVSVMHDENNNHQLDTNLMGIPKEAYGTSNNVRGGVGGPPRFEPASFALRPAGTTVAITVK